MPRNLLMEALSRAYVQAVAALAGMSYAVPHPDFGIDLTLIDLITRGSRHTESGFKLDVQAKSTTLAGLGPTAVSYDLDIRAYDDLRDPAPLCPRLLVVLVLPDNEDDWLVQTEEGLTLHRCAYWLSLRGRGASPNKRSVRVTLPREQVFSPASLRAIMDRVKRGGVP